jgi:tetratricopeptide (TPR) repeat protein
VGRFSRLERGKTGKVVVKPDKKTEAQERPTTETYDFPYYIARADEHFFFGEYEKALRLYSRALQLDNSQKYPWVGQIYCLLEMNQLKEADLWVARALQLFPEEPSLISLRAITYAHKGMLRRAIGTSDYALGKGSSIFAWIARGEVLLLADNKNSHFCFEKAMEMAEYDDWKTPMRIGMIYFKRKAYSNALEYFQKACASNVRNFYLWYYMSLCYHKLGFTHKAIETLKLALEHNPDFRPAERALEMVTHTPLFRRLWHLVTRK